DRASADLQGELRSLLPPGAGRGEVRLHASVRARGQSFGRACGGVLRIVVREDRDRVSASGQRPILPASDGTVGRGPASLAADLIDYAARAFGLLPFPSCWTPSTKAMPARTRGSRCAPSSRRQRACAMSRSL